MYLFFNLNSKELEPIADVLIELFNSSEYKYNSKEDKTDDRKDKINIQDRLQNT